MVRVPDVTGFFVSIAIKAAPQYSVSNPSILSLFEESSVTILQILQSLRASQDVAAQVTKINEAANKSLLFIILIYQFKDSKTLTSKGCFHSE